MKTLFIECASGISGNMMLGALIDLQNNKEDFLREIHKLNIGNLYDIIITRAKKHDVYGTHVDIIVKEEPTSRNIFDIRDIIAGSSITANAKALAEEIFNTLAKGEAKVHKTTIGKVHFHEVGAIDSIIDICGCAIILDVLEYDEIVVSPINLGSGKVKCAHGLLDVPAPAVKEILKNVPTYIYNKENGELTTPTGAAIIKTIANRYNVIDTDGFNAGIGVGTKNLVTQPNILKVYYDA